MNRVLHDFAQGSEEWSAFRLTHHGASEAAAMLGLSPHVTRSELLAAKHSGIAKEYSRFVQERILDRGHELEALARPIAEEILGDELYPATYSLGSLSASCDGLTMDGETAFEHKQWNAALAASVKEGVLPDEHQPQCQQVMLVTGAKRLLFVVSDGTWDRCEYLLVEPDADWQQRIRLGWEQFQRDLAEYAPVEVIPAAVAAPRMALPALTIQVNGAISLVDNLKVFGDRLQRFIDGLDQNPSDDQAFADSEAAIKTLQDAQDALEAAEQSALAQTASIDDMRRTVAMYRDQARNTRLMLEKLVKARKDAIRIEIVTEGRRRLAEHIRGLNQTLDRPYVPTVPDNFAGVIKGKKTVSSLRDAVDTELARLKIETSATADRVRINLKTIHEAGHAFLFADGSQLVLKEADYVTAIVKARIAEHEAAEAKRLEQERERIRAEEEAKLRREEEARRRQEEANQQREEQARARAEDEARRAQQPAPISAGKAKRAARPTKWVAELAGTEREAVAAIVAASVERPVLLELLRIDFDLVNELTVNPSAFDVPGFRAVAVTDENRKAI